MRTLLLVCVAATLFAQSSQPIPPPVGIKGRGKQIPKADDQQRTRENGPPKTAVPSPNSGAAPPGQSPAKPEANETKGQTQKTWYNRLDEGVGPSTWPNWALVIIGGLTAYAALRTLNAIKEQARIARIGLKATRVAASAATAGASAAKRSAELAERALHLTERADILVAGIAISTQPEFTPTSIISIVFKNFGRTRANRVEITGNLTVPNQIRAAKYSLPSAVMGAGETQSTSFEPMNRWMTQETFKGIVEGKLPLRFEVEVVYFDAFDRQHRTKSTGIFAPENCGFRIDANQEAD